MQLPWQHTNVVNEQLKAQHITKDLQYEGMLSTVAELLVLSSMDGIVRSLSTFGELATRSGLIPPLFEAVMGGRFDRMGGNIRHRGSPQAEKAILAHCAK